MIRIVHCYARKDKVLLDELERHLEVLKQSEQIITWHDREILPGAEWKYEIDSHLLAADIVLLLVSHNFFSSNYCHGVEMKRVLRRRELGKVYVIPIILRPVDWKETLIGDLQVLLTDGKPITMWRNRDEAFQDVVRGLRKVFEILPVEPIKRQRERIRIPLSEEEFNQALAVQEEAIRLNPNDAHAYHKKAQLFCKLDLAPLALDPINQAIRLDPNNANYYSLKSAIIDSFSDMDNALTLVEKAICLNPNVAYFHYQRSNLLIFLGCYDDALKAIKKAIELDPENPDEFNYYGTMDVILDALESLEENNMK
jgi:tetratricopeptide (TPR) repeat protein